MAGARVDVPIANGFYKSDSLPISAQECTNWYPNIVQAPALSQETLFGTPGLFQIATTGDLMVNANRNSHVKNGIGYLVNDSKLYRLNDLGGGNFSTTELGVVGGSGRVSMADNGTQLMILVPGGDAFIYNEDDGTPFQQITDPDFTASGNPEFVVYIDSVFVCSTDSKKFIASAINDGLAWNALDFGTAESDPDKIVAPIVFKNQLFIGGSETTEAFENIGGAAGGFQFQRSGLFLDKGIFSPFSIVDADNTFMFIGGGTNESPAVWAFAGNNMAKVSTTAIDSILQDLTQDELQDVFAISYAQRGAYFVCFSLPNTTICYDTVTQRWHERKSQLPDGLGGSFITRWRVESLITAYGKVIVGDCQDGRIGVLDIDTYKEYERPMIRRIATQPFKNQQMSFMVPMIELTIESGVGNDDVVDPKIRMDRSPDGKTFGNDRPRLMGKIGEYERRCFWARNGRAKRFEVFRFTLSDAVKPVIIGMTANIIGGSK